MANTTQKLGIEITTNSRQSVESMQRLKQSLGELHAGWAKLNSQFAQRTAAKAWTDQLATASTGAQRLKQSLDDAGQAAQKQSRSMADVVGSLAKLSLGLIAVQQAWARLSQLAQTADAYANLNARLKLVSGTAQELMRAQTELFAISQRNMTPLAETAQTYARLATSMRDLGRSQQDALNLTDSVAQALRISGASASESASALQQFGQALGKGVLNGDEFVSVMESAPRLARALAEGMGKTVGELKAMADAQELTSEKVVRAILSQQDTLKREAATLPTTVGGAIQQLTNAWTRYIGEADQATGKSRDLAEGIVLISRNMETLMYLPGKMLQGWGLLLDIITKTGAAIRELFSLQANAGSSTQLAERQAYMDRYGVNQAVTPEELAARRAQQPQQPYFDGQRRGAPATPPGAAGSGRSGRGHDTPYDATFSAAEAQYRLPPGLLKAVADVESSFNPRAISPVGAKGLMQFMPPTASRFGLRDPFDAEASIQAAGKYFRTLLSLFKGDLQKAIAAYNMGEGSERKANGVTGLVMRHGDNWLAKAPKETQAYVPGVLGKLEQYGDNVGLRDQFERQREAAQERERLAEETTRFETSQREASVEAAARADALTTARLEAAYQNRELSARAYYAQLDQLQRAATDRETAELTRQIGVERAAQATRTQGTLEYVQGQEAIFALEQKIAETRDRAAQTAQANQIALAAATREQNQALAEQLHQVKVKLLELQTDGPTLADIVIPPEQRELFQARLQVLQDQYREFMDRLRQAGDTAGLAQVRELITAEAVRAASDKFNQVTEFGIQAARNIQTAFADFLFDPFKDGLKGMARSFLDTIRRMAANAAAASIMRGVLGENFEKGELGGWLGGIIGAVRGDRPATPYPKGSVPDGVQVGPPAPSTVGTAVGAAVTVDETTFEGVLGSFKTGFEQIFNGDFFKGLGSIFEGGFGGIVSMLGDLLGGLFGGGSGGSGGAGSMVAEGVGTALEVIGAFFHTGGLVGAGGVTRALPARAFAGAPRYHAGGLAGLKPNEVPAVLMGGPRGQREEVLTANDPRHRDNLGSAAGGRAPAPFGSAQGTGAGGGDQTINVVNVLDPSLLGQFLSTKGGERLVMNVLSRNSGALQKLVSRG